MKTLSILFLTVLCIPCVVFAIEPVGTIGQPWPKEHAFLPNGFILRAVRTHIQIVHPDTGQVIDEFGEQERISAMWCLAQPLSISQF